MTGADRTDAQALADRAAELEEDVATSADYLAELCAKLGAYADDPASVAAIQEHLSTIERSCAEVAADLEEARRLLAACDSSPAG